ncbi:MAG: hypothetical protein SXQ77_11860, partial [Halobacteria archaeon]|nr:hypothetical protein [Halobacteria archaeon]
MEIDKDRRKFMATAATGAVAATGVASAQNETGNVSASESGSGNETASGGGGESGSRPPKTHEVKMVSDGSSYYFDPVGLHV